MIPIDTPQQLGQAVRSLRKQLKLKQSQLAMVSGVGVRFIVDLEAGKPTVRLENILRVINVLGVHLCLETPPSYTHNTRNSDHDT